MPFNVDTNRWTGLGVSDVDGAGNQTGQVCVGCGAAVYDGEGRLSYVPSASSSVQPVRYYYDGNGRRVMKVLCAAGSSSCDASTASAITTFVYDVQGELAAEYSATTADAGRKFLFADVLGSTRLYTAENGATVNCYDYLPFGEEVGASYGGRSGCYGTVSYPASPEG